MFEELLNRIRTGMTTRDDADALAPILNCVAEIARGAYTAQSCPLALAVLCQTARVYAARAQDDDHD
jgi:hypothetical protein